MRITNTEHISSTGNMEKLPEPSHPEIAFAGRSNVGKSSILNALTGRKNLFKVSSKPGRTRTIVHVEATIDIDGDNDAKFYLVDLPGYGYAKVSRDAKAAWAEFMHTYLSERPTLQLVIILVDVRRGPEEEEVQMLEFLTAHNIPALLVATKVDRVKKSQQKSTVSKLSQQCNSKVLATSATEKTGIDKLLRTIVHHCGFAG